MNEAIKNARRKVATAQANFDNASGEKKKLMANLLAQTKANLHFVEAQIFKQN